MSTTTTNLELVKPAGNERVDVDVINGNYDKIDEFAGLAITDANYVHTDNNYTTTEKNKLSAIQPNATATSFTQTLVSGTAVGTITINGTAYTIYAPSASGGASALNDLTDVTLASPSNGQVLKYNSTTGKWENADESGGGGGYIPTGEVYTFFTDGSAAAANYTLYVQWTDGETVTTALIVSYSELISGWTTGNYQNVTINWDRTNQIFNFVAKSGSFECNGTYFDEGDTMGTLSSGNITFNAMEKESTGVDWTQVQLSGTKIAEIEIDGVSQNVYAPTPPTKTSDLTNDSNFVADASYVHTDNNYTATEKNKLSGLVAVEANPSGTASTDLTKIAIGGTNYNIPSGGSGSSTFAGLSDVDIDDTTLANGQVPVWNSTTEKWENTFVSGGPTEFIETLDVGGQWVTYTYDLTDVYMVKIECDGDSYFISPTDIAVYSSYTTLFTKDNVNFNIARSADYQTLYVSFSVSTSLTADIYAMTRGGGGTTVIANPTGTPTDELNTIQIGNDIYEIVGGGGSGFSKTTLYTGTSFPAANTSIQLSNSIDSYDYIEFDTGHNTQHFNYTFTPEQLKDTINNGCWMFTDAGYACLKANSAGDEISFFDYSGWTNKSLLGVYGLKLEGGGGTTVIANPEGEATDTLTKIQIGDDIYEIAGGSGGSGFTKTTLYEISGTTPESVITLSQSIENFDLIEVVSLYGHSDEEDYKNTTMFNAEELVNSIGSARPKNWWVGNDTVYVWFYVTDVDEFTIHTQTGQTGLGIWYVYGYKFGGGSEGSAEWTDVVGTLEAGDTTITLSNGKIKTNSVVNPYASKVGVKASDMVIANGSVTLTFPVQTEDLDVMVRVTKVGGTPEPTPIDTTNTSKYNESSMNVVSSSSQMASVWNGGNAIGLTFYLTNPIDVTNLSKLYYELQTSSCYGGGSQAQQERWNVQIGLMATAPSAILNGTYSELNFVAGDDFSNSNTNYGTQEIDVSSLSGTYYLVINAHGWNAIISNLREE